LLHGESGYPNGDQSILPEGQAKLGMGHNLKKKSPVPPCVG
jgi:hypothetical protein